VFDGVLVLASISMGRWRLALAKQRRMGREDVASDVLLRIELEEISQELWRSLAWSIYVDDRHRSCIFVYPQLFLKPVHVL
jgi:hypothetical protein